MKSRKGLEHSIGPVLARCDLAGIALFLRAQVAARSHWLGGNGCDHAHRRSSIGIVGEDKMWPLSGGVGGRAAVDKVDRPIERLPFWHGIIAELPIVAVRAPCCTQQTERSARPIGALFHGLLTVPRIAKE